MHAEQRERTRELLRNKGIERALFAHPDSVTWLTGFAPFIELGASPYAGGPALVWYEDGHFTLVIVDSQAEYAAGYDDEPDGTLVTYEGYSIEHPIRGAEAMSEALRRLVNAAKGGGATGAELDSVTARQLQTLTTVLGSTTITPVDGWLKPLRMVKTAEELTKLRRSFELTDLGYRTALPVIRAGAREIDVWAAYDAAIQQAEGRPTPVGNDCVVGYRPFNVGGLPKDYPLRAGDSLIVDLSVIHKGYWSDGCRTFYAGEPTADQIKRHRFIQEALEYAVGLIRPGVQAKDVDAKVRAFVERGGYPVYRHHTGHGVGVSPHEEPRIVPYNETVLEAGMVIMLEPGTYMAGETGCRLEDGLLITADGVEVLTQYSRDLPPVK